MLYVLDLLLKLSLPLLHELLDEVTQEKADEYDEDNSYDLRNNEIRIVSFFRGFVYLELSYH